MHTKVTSNLHYQRLLCNVIQIIHTYSRKRCLNIHYCYIVNADEFADFKYLFVLLNLNGKWFINIGKRVKYIILAILNLFAIIYVKLTNVRPKKYIMLRFKHTGSEIGAIDTLFPEFCFSEKKKKDQKSPLCSQ